MMVLMIACGKRYFLQRAQMAREKAVKRFFPSRQRMVCSDCFTW